MSDFSEKKISGLLIKIDRTTCIATQNCIKAAPNFFELDDERICAFKDTTETTPNEEIIEACSVCPVSALLVFDEIGNQLVP